MSLTFVYVNSYKNHFMANLVESYLITDNTMRTKPLIFPNLERILQANCLQAIRNNVYYYSLYPEIYTQILKTSYI